MDKNRALKIRDWVIAIFGLTQLLLLIYIYRMLYIPIVAGFIPIKWWFNLIFDHESSNFVGLQHKWKAGILTMNHHEMNHHEMNHHESSLILMNQHESPFDHHESP